LAAASTRTAAGIVFLVAVAVLVAANGEALYAWLRLWAFGGLEYGFAILGISVWLLWQARGRLRDAAVTPDWRGLWLVVPVGIATWLAYLLDVRIAQYALFVAGLAALTSTLLGPAVLRVAAVPIAFFLLALPIWNYFKPALQAMTVHATALALELTGTPAFADETYIYTPGGEVLVLAQCSGAQYLQAGMTLGALYACTGFRSSSSRALVLAGFAAMAIAGNWIRVYVVIHLGRLTEWQHFMVGWGIFAVLLAFAFMASLRLQRREAGLQHVEYVAARGAAAYPTKSFTALIAVAVVATLLLVAGPIADRWPTASPPDRAEKIAPISVRAPWSGPFVADHSWQPLFAGAEAQVQGFYHSPLGDVSGYWAWYARQGHRSQVVNQSNAVYGAPWEPRGGYAGVYYKRIPVANQRFFEVSETWLSNPQTGAERLVWHWYCIAGRNVVQPWQAKLTQLGGLLHGRRDALVTVVSTDARDPGAASAVLRDFVLANFATLHAPASGELP
jgi:EpsI family protein